MSQPIELFKKALIHPRRTGKEEKMEMETMYRGKSQLQYFGVENERESWFEKRLWLKNIMIMTGTIVIALMLIWAMVSYFQIPYIHFSVSQQKNVAAYEANGQKMSVEEALQGRHEIIDVK